MAFVGFLVVIAAGASTPPPGAMAVDGAPLDDCVAESPGPHGEDWVDLVQTAMVLNRAGSARDLSLAPLLGPGLQEGGTTTTTPPPTGMTENAAGDLSAFLSAVMLNVGIVLGCIAIFCVLRVSYPLMYSNNALTGEAPSTPEDTYFGWARASLNTTTEQAAASIGLDNAMLIEFTHLGMKISALIGIPMLCVMGPVNCVFGGHAAGEDHLSYLSFGNIQFGSWLYWVYAFLVWGVVFAVQTSVYSAQRRFLPLRREWLLSMAELRSNTVLVENIPEAQQSDGALKAFFEKLLPGGKVKSAYVAKDITKLEGLVKALSDTRRRLYEAEFARARDPRRVPMARESFLGQQVEAIPVYKEKIRCLAAEVERERGEVLAASATPGWEGRNCCNGFVTLCSRGDAEHALRLEGISADQEEWAISSPPEPSDIQWRDLTQDPTAQSGRTLLGYALVAGLYFTYLPCVIGITNIANVIDLGPLQPLWQGVAPTLGLQVMVSFLPTLLLVIFRLFFTLRAAAWAQHKLQIWYFWFQVVFVILATAVGQNVTNFMRTLLADPFALFGVLADTMPYATHFFMNYIVLQWATHSMNILRYVPLAKFKMFSVMYEDEEARRMSEPEDQDYYGLGSRSARWTIMMTVGIVYGTLSPPINLLCFMNFALCRLVYGYLLPFAETRKPDLGGVFWVQMLKHIFIGNVIYCILMTGVLYRRSATSGPMMLAAPSIFYVLWSMHRFNTAFTWEQLPFAVVMQEGKRKMRVRRCLDGEYKQPELASDPASEPAAPESDKPHHDRRQRPQKWCGPCPCMNT